MGQLKKMLINKLENDPIFAIQYWLDQDINYIESEQPESNNLGFNKSNLILSVSTKLNSGLSYDIPPF